MSFTMTFFTKNTSWDTDTVPVICQDKYTCSIARDYPVFLFSRLFRIKKSNFA